MNAWIQRTLRKEWSKSKGKSRGGTRTVLVAYCSMKLPFSSWKNVQFSVFIPTRSHREGRGGSDKVVIDAVAKLSQRSSTDLYLSLFAGPSDPPSSEISDEELVIRVQPEEDAAGNTDELILALTVRYTPSYPDEMPELELEVAEGKLRESGLEEMRGELKTIGKESLGMAMVFTLASHLREALTNYVQRKRKEADEEDDKRRNEEIEAEAEKFRGTAVTADRFKAWKVAYEAERAAAAKAAENEHLSKLSGKEREEYKRRAMKPTGKELFSKGQFKEEDDDEAEEGVQEVDWSLYSRENREGRSEREEEEALVTVSDDEE